jgi:hypothetical protein
VAAAGASLSPPLLPPSAMPAYSPARTSWSAGRAWGIADWVTDGDGGTPGTLAGVLGTGSRDRGQVELRRLQVTTVAGLDFPRATQAIRGTAGSARAAAASGARSPWTPVTSLPSHQAGAAQLAGWLGGHRVETPAAPRPRRSRHLTVAAVSHLRARR